MAQLDGNSGRRQARVDCYTIGLVADTHDVADPSRVIALLSEQRCDYHVHLGDIGGSQAVMNTVREFKRQLGDPALLSRGQRQQYDGAIARGEAPLRAYIEARLGDDGKLLRRTQLTEAYRMVLDRMARLQNPILLRGNVDSLQLTVDNIQACFAQSPLALETRPRLIDLEWLGLVIWPSWRPVSQLEREEQAEATMKVSEAAATKRMIIVLAHEQCFKGPGATVYSERVARAGLRQLTVPRFDPNPSWPCLLQLFRRLPPEVRAYYVFGHVHDPLTVLTAGVPALRNPSGLGMRYRLYGLGWRGERLRAATDMRREIVMLPVGVGEVARLEAKRGVNGVGWQVLRPTGE